MIRTSLEDPPGKGKGPPEVDELAAAFAEQPANAVRVHVLEAEFCQLVGALSPEGPPAAKEGRHELGLDELPIPRNE